MRMKTLLALVALLALPMGIQPAAAQAVNGMNIPTTHPRIWWNAERLQRARALYQANPFNPGTPGANNEYRSVDNAFVSLMTGQASYCRAAINYAMTVIIPQGQLDGVASDNARWYGEYVILTYDWCYQHMTASERATMITRWNGFLNTLRLKDWGGLEMPQSNYFWGYFRNELLWGIATYGENTMATTFLDHALNQRWTNSFVAHASTDGVGGLAHEGGNYGAALYDYSTIMLRSADLLGRDVFGETNYFKETVYALIYGSPPARTDGASGPGWDLFPFGDDGRFREGNWLASQTFADYMQMAAERWSNEPAGRYARNWLTVVGNSSRSYIRAVDAGGQTTSFSSLPLDYYARGATHLFGRTGWNSTATAVHFQLGQTVDDGHQHADKGNFQIWRNGRWLTREATGYVDSIVGYNNRSANSQSAEAHNTLLVGGQGVAQWPRTQATVRRLESTASYLYANTDLSSLYSSGAHVEREFLFLRQLETTIVFDRIQTATSVPRTFIIHFEQAPTLESNSRALATNGNQALRLITAYPANAVRRVVDEGGSTGLDRLEVEATAQGVDYLLNVLQARDSGGSDVTATVTDTGSSFRLNVSHPTLGSAEVVFQKGATSTGGTLALNGSSAAPLLNRVQGFQVTVAGPAWEGAASVKIPAAPTGLTVQ
jgi:hypothetical protein